MTLKWIAHPSRLAMRAHKDGEPTLYHVCQVNRPHKTFEVWHGIGKEAQQIEIGLLDHKDAMKIVERLLNA